MKRLFLNVGVNRENNQHFSRHGEHGWSPYGKCSPHTSLQYSSPSPDSYSPQIQIPGSSDYIPPERRHAWVEAYATLDQTERKERYEGSHHYRK